MVPEVVLLLLSVRTCVGFDAVLRRCSSREIRVAARAGRHSFEHIRTSGSCTAFTWGRCPRVAIVCTGAGEWPHASQLLPICCKFNKRRSAYLYVRKKVTERVYPPSAPTRLLSCHGSSAMSCLV